MERDAKSGQSRPLPAAGSIIAKLTDRLGLAESSLRQLATVRAQLLALKEAALPGVNNGVETLLFLNGKMLERATRELGLAKAKPDSTAALRDPLASANTHREKSS